MKKSSANAHGCASLKCKREFHTRHIHFRIINLNMPFKSMEVNEII